MFVTFLSGRMIPGGPLYGFCIGNSYTTEKNKFLTGNTIKTYEKLQILHESFRGAFEPKLGPHESKNTPVTIVRSVCSQIGVLGLF